MKLADKEKTTIQQDLDRFCNEVDINQANGEIRTNIAGNLICVIPNKYGELELEIDKILSKDTHEMNKIMMVLKYLNDYMGRHQITISAEQKLSVNLKAANLVPSEVIQLYKEDHPLNYFQIGYINNPDGTPRLTMTCLDNGFTLATSNKIDELIDMLIVYLKVHHNTTIPEDFYHRYSFIRLLP